jgi:hypothetical protein
MNARRLMKTLAPRRLFPVLQKVDVQDGHCNLSSSHEPHLRLTIPRGKKAQPRRKA